MNALTISLVALGITLIVAAIAMVVAVRMRRALHSMQSTLGGPPILAPRPSSSLPVVTGDPDQLCRTCARWDLDEGQAMARQHGPFMIAAQYVPPSEMGAVATPEGEIEARDIPAKATWAEFGLCHLRHEGIWGNTDAARRARMQDDDGVPGQFLKDGADCYTTEGP